MRSSQPASTLWSCPPSTTGSPRQQAANGWAAATIVLKSNIHQANAGQLDIRIDNDVRNFKLYSSVDAFRPALDPYLNTSNLHQWDAQHPAPVLLLKLSGHFGADASTVVSPASVKKQP
ncbi:hypothetical protein [Deinococcus humi]|uniref:Uncharacterized protein n=1 Tax=Deinococcus humi TaxID=662880 RepID=A0A7W8NDV2_9DEIO|nr:hypothetical protein [Deinococcus humi]MBB5363614.1 hypothetical protein [Deinococcus humi]